MSPEEAEQVQTSVYRKLVPCTGFAVAAVVLFAGAACAAPELALTFPGPAVATAQNAVPLTSYQMPIGPYKAGALPVARTEGRLEQQAWRIPAENASTLDLMTALRDQVIAAGFDVVFECATESCGGFDFRFGTEILAEPDMHVDLGDFRFLSAKRDTAGAEEYLSLLVSRSPLDGYVQLTRIGALGLPAPDLAASTKTPAPGAVPAAAPAVPEVADLASALSSGAPVVLEDLAFGSGSAALQAGDYASLAALAEWLKANPGKTVLLVGHTDGSGALAANTSLSRRRADSVRQVLLAKYGIPAAQVAAEGVGSLAPRASNLDEAGRMKNRRVEVFQTSTP